MKNTWSFVWCSLAAPSFEIAGKTIPDEILKSFKDTKEIVEVPCPLESRIRKARVYSYTDGATSYNVALTEVSPGVYTAYVNDHTLPYCMPRFRWADGKWEAFK